MVYNGFVRPEKLSDKEEEPVFFDQDDVFPSKEIIPKIEKHVSLCLNQILDRFYTSLVYGYALTLTKPDENDLISYLTITSLCSKFDPPTFFSKSDLPKVIDYLKKNTNEIVYVPSDIAAIIKIFNATSIDQLTPDQIKSLNDEQLFDFLKMRISSPQSYLRHFANSLFQAPAEMILAIFQGRRKEIFDLFESSFSPKDFQYFLSIYRENTKEEVTQVSIQKSMNSPGSSMESSKLSDASTIGEGVNM